MVCHKSVSGVARLSPATIRRCPTQCRCDHKPLGTMFKAQVFSQHTSRSTILGQPQPNTSLAMATRTVTRQPFSFGVALTVVALLVPSAHVPPAWWQGGWRRTRLGSSEEVELLSPVAAMLMPKTPVGELFRSFPSPDGEDLEPTLTAYGVMKDPNAALYIHYDGTHGKREGLNDDFQKRLLAYGPAGSRILHISHTKSRPLADMVLCIKVGEWHPGDNASLSLVLNNIRKQILHGLKLVMCPAVLEQLQSHSFTSVMHDFCVSLRLAFADQKSLECRLFSRGFSPAYTNRMLKSARLSEQCAEAKLASRILYLLNLNHSQTQIREALATSSPALGDNLQKNLKQTVQWLWNLGLEQQEVGQVIAIFPSLLGSSALQNLEATVLWLLDMGLSHRQVVNVVGCCPEVFAAGRPHMEWLVKLGMTKNQIKKAVCAFPMIFGCSIQEDLLPKLDWFSALGLTKKQIAKLIATLPHILTHCIEKKLEPKVKWFFQLGMTRGQVAKLISAFPSIFGYSVERNLRPKVEWLLQLGMTQDQIVKVIAASPHVLSGSLEQNLKPKIGWLFQLGMTRRQVVKMIVVCPSVLAYSIEKNLKPKAAWLLQMGMTRGQVAKMMAASPQVLGYSIEQNLKPKVQWLLQLGIGQGHLAKLIAAFPRLLGCSVDQNLKRKVEWLLHLGMSQDQVANVVLVFPQILSLSIEKNLEPKHALLQKVLGAQATLQVVRKRPQIMGLNYLRFSTRLMILFKRNETARLASAMTMTSKSFKSRFLDDL